MDYLEELFEAEVVGKIGNGHRIHLFGRDISLEEILPVASELRGEVFSHWKKHKGEEFSSRMSEIAKIGENRQRFSELSTNYNTGDLLPFIGAGFSVPSGLASWVDLLNDLAVRVSRPLILKRIREMIARSDYEDAADEIYNRLGKRLFDELLENRYRVLNFSEINGPVKLIPSIFKGTIITTNFDNIIETILENYGEELDIYEGTELKELNIEDLNQRQLIKIHGDYKKPGNRVLLKEEYERVYRDREFKLQIKSLSSAKSILFLGCSLVNDRYLKTMKPKNGDDAPKRHYAFVRLPMRNGERGCHDWMDRQNSRLSKFNIFPIWIENYEDIDAILYTMVKIYAEEVELV